MFWVPGLTACKYDDWQLFIWTSQNHLVKAGCAYLNMCRWSSEMLSHCTCSRGELFSGTWAIRWKMESKNPNTVFHSFCLVAPAARERERALKNMLVLHSVYFVSGLCCKHVRTFSIKCIFCCLVQRRQMFFYNISQKNPPCDLLLHVPQLISLAVFFFILYLFREVSQRVKLFFWQEHPDHTYTVTRVDTWKLPHFTFPDQSHPVRPGLKQQPLGHHCRMYSGSDIYFDFWDWNVIFLWI